MTDQEIQDNYKLIKQYHQNYLKKKGVKLPKLKNRNAYTKDALTLVYLANGYPETNVVSKTELTEFIKIFYPDVNDVQQARHLAAQKGWYILSGTRNDIASIDLGPGEYKLNTLEDVYPGFTADRRLEIGGDDYFENLKKVYGGRCATCGSKEGEPNIMWPNTITVLQKGHMDPTKPLEPGNIIPQCEKCNRADRNYWVYDKKGRVVKIANAKVIDNCSQTVKREIYERLKKEFE